jgi:DNA-directed RNA polymerase subunit RPC12/RpoP
MATMTNKPRPSCREQACDVQVTPEQKYCAAHEWQISKWLKKSNATLKELTTMKSKTLTHTPQEVGNCTTCGHRSLGHTIAGECNYRDSGFDGTSARCTCDMYMQPRRAYTPMPCIEHQTSSISSNDPLSKIYTCSKCSQPFLMDRTIRAVNSHQELVEILKAIAASFNGGADKVYSSALWPKDDEKTLGQWINEALARAEKESV